MPAPPASLGSLASLAPAGAHVLIVASSLSENSRSQQLARLAAAKLEGAEIKATLLDLTAHPLPFAGTGAVRKAA